MIQLFLFMLNTYSCLYSFSLLPLLYTSCHRTINLTSQTLKHSTRQNETPMHSSVQILSSSEHLSSGYSSSNTPIPTDYLMPVATETMVKGQHCINSIYILQSVTNNKSPDKFDSRFNCYFKHNRL